MDAKYFRNCCNKGRRAFMPYTGNWPYTEVFPPNDQRQDQWAAQTDPQNYLNGRYICWPDDSNTNWGCISAAPNSWTLWYYKQRQWIDRTQPWGKR